MDIYKGYLNFCFTENLNLMKKPLSLLAVVFCILGLLGYAMKLLHLPGAGVMITVSIVGMLIMLVSWFAVAPKNLLDLSIFLFGVFFLTGLLFKLMHWPLENILFGLIPVFGLLLITATIATRELGGT